MAFFEISYTKARTYLNCPWLYKLKFLDDWKAPPGPDASLGISLHKALERYHRGQERGIEALWAALDEAWDRAGYGDSGQELEFYDRARAALERYRSEIDLKWTGRVFEVEKNFVLDLSEIGLKLIGSMDRVDRMADGSYVLIEYKTHVQPWSAERMAADLQMTIYSHAAREIFGAPQMGLFFFFVSQGVWTQVTRGPEDWQGALRALGEIVRKVRQSEFTADTRYCPFCEMRKSCGYSVVR